MEDNGDGEEEKIGWGGQTIPVASSAVWSCCRPHFIGVFGVVGHYLTLDSRVGIIPPMEPTVMGTGTRLGEERRVSMGGGGNRHIKMCVVGLVSLHTGNPGGQRLDLGEIGARRKVRIRGGYGLDGGRCGQSRGATGTPTHAGTGWCSGSCISRLGHASVVFAVGAGVGVGFDDGTRER
jgi:hypothetical protein